MRYILAKFIGEDDPSYFVNGKIYKAIARSADSNELRIIGENKESYIYGAKYFEAILGKICDLPIEGNEYSIPKSKKRILIIE
ncbi:hypothetical protein [Lutispora sp.]|uniref:hypothetical protein n=1 Tax=Lutispora sp. TaxID=2828727 RepID=UPI003567A665